MPGSWYPMNIARTGIILNVERFDACVGFYRELFGLQTLYEERDGAFRLACFGFGGSYLMIETGGSAMPEGKSVEENASKIRINVADIESALESVRAYGIDAEITANDWGSTIDIYDPDGNRVGIREEQSFETRIKAG